jgi:hypothetical protein
LENAKEWTLNMRKKNSILFVKPDYHCSFIYREEFRKAGWQADIYLPYGYPQALLYSAEDLLQAPRLKRNDTLPYRMINHLLLIFWWLSNFWRYEYHLYYGRPPAVTFFESSIGLGYLFGNQFLIELWLAKLFKVKLIFLPTGCHDDETKENFTKLDNGNVCNNCGSWNNCDDGKNLINFKRVNHYFDLVIGFGAINSTQFRASHIRYKSIDLNLWRPNLEIPAKHKLPPSNNIRILHSAYLSKSGRGWMGRNIKGSPYVLAAIERLQKEGHPVDYYFIEDIPSNEMRFYQAQADIVVEQLIYGWWGSTFVETSALGKPVVCYLRPQWKTFFLKTFPEYTELPVIEADTLTIYSALKKLVTDVGYRNKKGMEARFFAENHFNSEKNTVNLIKILENL